MRGLLAAPAALLLAVTACSTGPQAAHSCVEPTLAVAPSSARAGGTVHVSGEFFAANCADTVVDGKTAKTVPLTGLQLDIVQNEHTWTVAKDLDASGSHQSVDVAVRLPTGLRPGPAVIHVPGYGTPATLTVVG